MGMRLRLACGWGMKPEDFIAKSLLSTQPESGKFSLYTTLAQLEERKELVIPRKEWKEQDQGPGIMTWVDDLLKGGLSNAVDDSVKKHWPENKQARSARDLIEIVGYDDAKLLLFWPDAGTKADLFRYDDDLDFVVNMMSPSKPGKERKNPTDELISPLIHNPYPYSNDVQKDGKRAEWPGPFGVKTYPEYAPAPPKALVWWLVETKTLSYEDAMTLRPYLCRWWS